MRNQRSFKMNLLLIRYEREARNFGWLKFSFLYVLFFFLTPTLGQQTDIYRIGGLCFFEQESKDTIRQVYFCKCTEETDHLIVDSFIVVNHSKDSLWIVEKNINFEMKINYEAGKLSKEKSVQIENKLFQIIQSVWRDADSSYMYPKWEYYTGKNNNIRKYYGLAKLVNYLAINELKFMEEILKFAGCDEDSLAIQALDFLNSESFGSALYISRFYNMKSSKKNEHWEETSDYEERALVNIKDDIFLGMYPKNNKLNDYLKEALHRYCDRIKTVNCNLSEELFK
ncbi:MAG: hypothetical protein R2799_11915 [Crocinitomicaceae bacterium]